MFPSLEMFIVLFIAHPDSYKSYSSFFQICKIEKMALQLLIGLTQQKDFRLSAGRAGVGVEQAHKNSYLLPLV